jgi:ABC-2 type transport system ATP-binding protein
VIRVSHLTRRYGAHVAVDDVSFEVRKGEVLGFLGPNGAGKSTTLRVLAGFLGPTAGTVAIDDHDVVEDSFEARRRIGYMPEGVPLPPEMRVVEYLRFRAELKRVPRSLRTLRIEDAMGKAAVVDVAHKLIGHLSKGYRQRVGLADALVADPPIVILDEPTSGLDPNQIRDVRKLVRELGRDHAVVLSTHILSEVEACATRVLLLHRGKVVAEGPTDEIRALRGGVATDIVVRGEAAIAERTLAGVEGVATVARIGLDGLLATIRVTFTATAEPDAVEARGRAVERCVAALIAAGMGVREARPSEGSLEEVFAALTRERAAPGPETLDAASPAGPGASP